MKQYHYLQVDLTADYDLRSIAKHAYIITNDRILTLLFLMLVVAEHQPNSYFKYQF